MITKTCKCCKKEKQLGDFFSVNVSAHDHRTSNYCKACHAAGKIPYGYGWYAGGHETPQDNELGNVKISWLKNV